MADERVGGSIRSPHVTQHLLKLSGGDVVTADRKILPAWTGVIPVRIVIITNVVPSVPDSSGALASRFIVLWYRRLRGREDIALGAKLAAELPGILNWALEGWRRLQQRGHFVQQDGWVSAGSQGHVEDLSSEMDAFIKERCKLGSTGYKVATETLYEAFIQYRRDNNQNDREHPEMRTFGRDLASAARKVVKIYSGPKKARFHAYRGHRAQTGVGAEEVAATR